YGGLVPLALYVSFMVAIVGLWRERPQGLEAMAATLVGAAAIVTGYAFVQVSGHDPFHWGATAAEQAVNAAYFKSQPGSTLGNSNFAGSYLGITLPLVVALAALAPRRQARLAWIMLALAQVGALVLTRSRGGVVAGLAGLAVLALVHRRVLPGWLKALAALA